jgi:EAL domain-containing protein (putative c-di-GMP-specific phosphodiesterase class I)
MSSGSLKFCFEVVVLTDIPEMREAGRIADAEQTMSLSCSKCEPSGADRAIDIAYQPIFDLRTGRARAYEALVRGARGEGAARILSAVSEEERHRFEQRVRVMAIEKAGALGIVASGAALSINTNPSAVLEAERCLGHTIAAVLRVGLPPSRLVFEFTESARLDVEHARGIVEIYRAHGFRTALDDFGDGYAGLVTLADVPTDFVKLDIGLVRGIDSSRERQVIVAGLVDMMASLGREVVAEGIETGAELATVKALGIALVQGFYLGRPSRTELQREPYGIARAA